MRGIDNRKQTATECNKLKVFVKVEVLNCIISSQTLIKNKYKETAIGASLPDKL
jgi:hypothetical protein